MKIVTIIGARPQIIKAAALSRTIKHSFKNDIEEVIVHTGQHYDNNMSAVFFNELDIPYPNYNLNIGSGMHGVQTARMIEGIEDVLIKEEPDYIVLYGDTNSTLAGAVAASKMNIPIVHIEAGLRSFNRRMPEEINRIACDHLSTLLFTPTLSGYNHLKNEGFNLGQRASYSAESPGVFHCGDVMYDNSLFFSQLAIEKSKILDKYDLVPGKFLLATVHRDHNTDNPVSLKSIFESLLTIAHDVKVVLPLHPRTKKVLEQDQHKSLYSAIKKSDNFVLIPPASFLDMIQLEQHSSLIITDSGGVQKEAYFFNKPCIILRSETEWVEILETGQAVLVGHDINKVLLSYKKFKNFQNFVFEPIFGDGHAAQFICSILLDNYSGSLSTYENN